MSLLQRHDWHNVRGKGGRALKFWDINGKSAGMLTTFVTKHNWSCSVGGRNGVTLLSIRAAQVDCGCLVTRVHQTGQLFLQAFDSFRMLRLRVSITLIGVKMEESRGGKKSPNEGDT